MRKPRRPEILKPGLKQLTPIERKVVEARLADHKKRWEYLFHPDRNRWVLIK